MTRPAEPLPKLAEALLKARRAGVPFEQAWPRALDSALAGLRTDVRRAWLVALTETREAWADAYVRRGRPLRWSRALVESASA